MFNRITAASAPGSVPVTAAFDVIIVGAGAAGCAVPMSNWPRQRASAAICYLDADVRRRGNLSIACNAFVTGLVFDGRRVAGVRVRIGAQQKEFFAREVIVALGGIHSHAFLMRAGFGRPRCAMSALRCTPICPP